MRLQRALIVVVLLALLAVLQQQLWYGDAGETAVRAMRAQVAAQVQTNEALKQRNDALAAEVADLKSGEAAIEERARAELGMIKPGEIFYRVVEDGPAALPTPLPEGQ